MEVAIRHVKSLIDPFQLEIQRIHSYEGWQSKQEPMNVFVAYWDYILTSCVQADIRVSDELQVMKRVFLIGGKLNRSG